MMPGDTTQGRATTAPPWEMEPGDYNVRNDENGERVAWVVPPNGVRAARLTGWTLTEHDDALVVSVFSAGFCSPEPPIF